MNEMNSIYDKLDALERKIEKIANYCKRKADEANDARIANKDNDISWYLESGRVEAYKDVIRLLEDKDVLIRI